MARTLLPVISGIIFQMLNPENVYFFISFLFLVVIMLYLLVISRWRINIRKALSPAKKTEPATTAEVDNEHEVVDEDDRILNEMEELTNAMDRKKKREKKILSKRRAKVCGFLVATEYFGVGYNTTQMNFLIFATLLIVSWKL